MFINEYRTTAYNSQGQAQETETCLDRWVSTEMCYDLSEEYGYAETLDAWGKHCGEYGDRPTVLGERRY